MAANGLIKETVLFHDRFENAFSSATNGLIASRCVYKLGTGTLTVARGFANGGSYARITTDTNQAGDIGLFGPRAISFSAGQGLATVRARIRGITSVAAAAWSIGISDADDDSLGVNYEDASVVSTPTDGLFAVYDEPAQSTLSTWFTLGVGNDVDDVPKVATNIDAPVLSTWTTVELQIRPNPASTSTLQYQVHVDGKRLKSSATDVNGWTNSVARASVVYCPAIFIAGRGTAYSLDVAEFYAKQNTGTAID